MLMLGLGWFIVILKSDNSNPVDHAGTTVFLREHSSDTQVSHELPPDDAVEVIFISHLR